jgi:hypothetical protein
MRCAVISILAHWHISPLAHWHISTLFSCVFSNSETSGEWRRVKSRFLKNMPPKKGKKCPVLGHFVLKKTKIENLSPQL